ncbi:MAG: AAA family ATPase, partial [Planctomycetota bacterium]
MIKTIKIKGFKSIVDTQSINNLGQINVLTGGNNSGKTAFLEALWILGEVTGINNSSITANWSLQGNAYSFQSSQQYIDKIRSLYPQKTNFEDFISGRKQDGSFSIETAFEIDGQTLIEYFNKGVLPPDKVTGVIKEINLLKICFEVYSNRVILSWFSWGDLNLTYSSNTPHFLDVGEYFQSSLRNKNFRISFNANLYLNSFTREINNSLKQLSAYYINSKRKIQEDVLLENQASDIKGLDLKRKLFGWFHSKTKEDNDKYNKVLNLFNRVANKKIREKPSYDTATHRVDIVFEEGATLVDIDNSGYGYYQILNLIYNIVNSKANIIIIDEPEISLHPQAQMRLFEAIKTIAKSENKQFFIATHSPYFIDLENIRNVYRAEKNTAGTHVYQITDRNLKDNIERQQDRIFHFRSRELFFTDSVIFVEGYDDMEYYLRFIGDNYPELKG